MHPKDAIFSVEKIISTTSEEEEEEEEEQEPFFHKNDSFSSSSSSEEEKKKHDDAGHKNSLAHISDSNFFEFSSNDIISDEFYQAAATTNLF